MRGRGRKREICRPADRQIVIEGERRTDTQGEIEGVTDGLRGSESEQG